MKLTYKITLLFFMLPFLLQAQSEPKREMRSVWVATVSNIDWPKTADRNNAAAQKADLLEMLDLYKETNINTIFLQVRTECDALYQSAYEPWSRYLTYAQGDDPGYDPLQFAIDEGHKRGIEVHAWLNPYRINASTSDDGSYYDDTHIFIEHPEWAITYSTGKRILNPGLPEVMSYIGDIVEDLASKYNIDGIHFDDYFYAYGGTSTSLDQAEYDLYGGSMSRSDWRRDNVNRMVDTVYATIQRTNPNIRFGVSPFGIWRPGYPAGISGMDAYATIYCDPLAWLEDQSVDYLTPQLYWPTGGSQDFESLVGWWSDQVSTNDRHLYPGMGTYRLSNSPSSKKTAIQDSSLHENKTYFDKMDNFSKMEEYLLKSTSDPVSDWTLSEIGKQIGIIRENNNKNALGSVFFSAKDLTRVSGLQNYLVENSFTHLAIVPEMTWKAGNTPSAPLNINIEEIDMEEMLTWDYTVSDNIRFAIYNSTESSDANEIISNPENLQAISFTNSISLEELNLFESSTIVVTAISALGKESSPSASFDPSGDFPLVTLVSPTSGSILDNTSTLRWSSEYTDPDYNVQISTNNNFTKVVYDSDWISATSLVLSDANLDGETTYFWRARVNNGTTGFYSDYRYFSTGFPACPTLLAPSNLDQNLSTKPNIKWESTGNTANIRVQVSKSNTFSTLAADELIDASLGEHKLATKLDKDSWYFIRISGDNSYGSSKVSNYVTFSTSAGEVPEVNLLSPENLVTAASFDKLTWETTASEGTILYYLEAANDEDFNSILFNSGWISDTELLITNMGLEGARTYHWHVKGKSEFGESDFSSSRTFYAGYPTRPTITKPLNLSTGIYAKPTVGWSVDASTDNVYVEFSEQSEFETIKHSESFPSGSGESEISASLKAYTGYYLRMKAGNEFGQGVFSAIKYFETGESTFTSYDISNGKLDVYPTFVENGEFFIHSNSDNLHIERIDILDLTGRVYKSLKIANSLNEIIKISADGLPKQTTIFVRIITKDQVTVASIIIKN